MLDSYAYGRQDAESANDAGSIEIPSGQGVVSLL